MGMDGSYGYDLLVIKALQRRLLVHLLFYEEMDGIEVLTLPSW